MINPAIASLAAVIVKMIGEWVKEKREYRKHKLTQLFIILAAIIAALSQIFIAMIKSKNRE